MKISELLNYGEFEEIRESIEQELLYETLKPPTEILSLIETEIKAGKRKNPEDYPKNYGILVRHWRGKSEHLDFRRKQNGWLEGETVVDEPKDVITQDIKTIDDGKKWTEKLDKEKLFKFRPDMNPDDKVVVIPKAKQPLEWLNVREIAIEPGEVGATAEKYGVFITEDEGMVYPGVQKPYAKEFFLDMQKYKGRMMEVLIGVGEEWKEKPKKPLQWQCSFNLQDQTPYILSRRGRTKKDYIPKENESALSPEWEKRIPAEFQWWTSGLKDKEKLKRLDQAYNYLIDKEILKGNKIEIKESFESLIESKIKWTLRRHYWKGPTVVRGQAVSTWDLLIDSGKDYLDVWKLESNPLDSNTAIPGKHIRVNIKTPAGESYKEWMNWEGAVAPDDARFREVEVMAEDFNQETQMFIYSVQTKNGDIIKTKDSPFQFKIGTKAYIDQRENIYPTESRGAGFGNYNERIPAYYQLLSTGTGELIEDGTDFKSMKLNGALKDYKILKRISPESDIWNFQVSALPGEMKEDKGSGPVIKNFEINDDTKFPLIIKCSSKTYELNLTSKGGLILTKSEK